MRESNGKKGLGVEDSQEQATLAAKDPYYILARAPQGDERSRVLKHGETFAVFDHFGDVTPAGVGEEGLYHEGTRFLSSLILELGKGPPFILSSTVRDDNALLAVDLTNPDLYVHNRLEVPRGTVHIFRSTLLWEAACYQRLRLHNYAATPLTLSFSLQFAADFADIFEVRGTKRKRRGTLRPPSVGPDGVVLAYRGLDGQERRTRLEFSPRPRHVTGDRIFFDVELPSQGNATFYLTVHCETEAAPPVRPSYEAAQTQAVAALHADRQRWCQVRTSNEQFNDWINRSLSDLNLMTTETEHGPYPYAGIPWFSTAFGRDGIITALECLWVYPEMARGVLGFLADTQADEVNPEQDAEPGKILHETRKGEMAALGEIPFGRYYGSIDSTPLFVMLAGAYHEQTGDRAFLETIWPNVGRALAWIDDHGDQDGDGFVEYFRHSPEGLIQQGWKDSHDSVFHADGSSAEGPIALCEVQGYVYAARLAAARLAEALGRPEPAARWRQQAEVLRKRFHKAFWCQDLGTYALALDGEKRPCRVFSSNAGQCLFTGIADPRHARRIADGLMAEESYSGWGVRTLAAGQPRYNPMSYHNGSIWPHDNALIAHGLAQYHLQEAALRVLAGMFDASLFVELHRLPELFCGFPRRPGEGPTLYPVACAPQAWAAGAVFLLLQACLGMSIQGDPPRILFSYPKLPPFLNEVWVHNLRAGKSSVDLRLQRHEEDTGIEVLRRKGPIEIVTVK